jgi:D-3-phosphoglycerate dehydrogenase
MADHKFKVVIAEKMAEDGIHILRFNPAFEVVVLDKKEKDRLKQEVKTADAVVVRSGVKFTKDLLEDAPKLKIVGRAGAGYDNIDVPACSEKGVVVMAVPGGNSNGVVELTIGLMIALLRHIPKADATMKQGKWEKNNLEGNELRGKTIGLIGLGKIGGMVGAICEALGMKVMALVKNPNKKRNVPFTGIFVEKLEDLLPNIDILSLHLPSSAETKGMIGAKELAMMKPGAYLINTARGNLVDEAALYEVLKNKKIAGAAIDVYSEEPAPIEKFPFIGLDNVVAMPHLGASTFESQANVSKIICENIIQALTTGVYLDAVNLPFQIATPDAMTYQPYIALVQRLARFAGQWSHAKLKEIKLTYRFTKQIDIKPIVHIGCAIILGYTQPEVSLISVQKYLDQQHIGLVLKQSQQLGWDDSLKIALTYVDGTSFEIRGVVAAQTVPKIVEIQDRLIEFIPTGHWIVYENKNVPGVVGSVGTLLGNEKINIADIHLSKAEPNETVMGCISVDQEVPTSILEKISKLDNILNARWVNLD